MAFVSMVHYTITGHIIVFYFPLIMATVELIVLYFSSSFAYSGLVQNASFYKFIRRESSRCKRIIDVSVFTSKSNNISIVYNWMPIRFFVFVLQIRSNDLKKYKIT